MRLPPVDRVEDYAPFLAKAVRTHLDTEWMPQDCHKTIGDEVEGIFRECLTQVRCGGVPCRRQTCMRHVGGALPFGSWVCEYTFDH